MFKIGLNIVLGFIKGIKWTSFKISLGINIILGILLYFNYYTKVPDNIEVITYTKKEIVIPSQIGTFKAIIHPIATSKNINAELLSQYTSLKDSISKLKLYEDAITEREYNEVYDDSLVTIHVFSKTIGKLIEQKPWYVIKPTSITYVEKTTTLPYQPRNKILGGFELGMGTNFLPKVKAGLYFQNKKDNIISFSYDINKTIWVGYIFKL